MILRTCNADFTSAHDPSFQWPNTVGAVVYPREWDPSPECGNGLHGFLYGEGDRDLADWSEDAQWIVFEGDFVVDLGRKVKTNRATILHIGRGNTAYDRLQDCHTFMRAAGKLGPRAFNSHNTGGEMNAFAVRPSILTKTIKPACHINLKMVKFQKSILLRVYGRLSP